MGTAVITIRLRALVSQKGEWLAELARATGLSYSTVHRIHAGAAKRYDVHALETLCAHFEVGKGGLFERPTLESFIDDELREKLRRWPATLERLRAHCAAIRATYGTLPDSTPLIRAMRQAPDRWRDGE